MPAEALLFAIEIAIFVPSDPETLTLTGACPDWLRGLAEPGRPVATDDAFPFLRGFLQVAAAVWKDAEPKPLLSDIWVQTGRGGQDMALRATAVTVEGKPFLLIQKLGEEFEERQSALQRSRERGLDNERLERIARELSAANAEAEKSVQDKSDFLAGMSHDLRTPLNAMLGFTTILLQGRAGELNQKQRGYLEQVRHAADHLQALIDDVLDLSRIEAGFLDLRREDFSLEAAMREVLAIVAPLAEAKAITVHCLPAELQVARDIYADRVRLQQILFNLLSNAIKFTSRGGTVAIAANESPEWVEIAVTDTGRGIPVEEITAIFGKFHQVRMPGDRGGAGLGLAITRRLVEQHGGDILAESVPGAGSRFTFRLPFRR